MNYFSMVLVVLYAVTLGSGWMWHTKTLEAQAVQTKSAIESSIQAKAKAEEDLAVQKNDNDALKKRIDSARVYASFLSLALCPTLESGNKEAFCTQDSKGWLNKTIETGVVIPDQETKDALTKLVLILPGKNGPSTKQIFETLKPAEARALKALIEDLL